MGGDPHFSIVLPDNHMLCYTVQGEPGLVFNLISNAKFYMNALFAYSSEEWTRTSMGALPWSSLSNVTKLVFNGTSRDISFFGDDVFTLNAKTVQGLDIHSSELSLSHSPKCSSNPSVMISLGDITARFTQNTLKYFGRVLEKLTMIHIV